MKLLASLLGGLLLGCGLQTLELAPTTGDVILLDPVPLGAVSLLQQADDGAKPEPKLTLVYPADGCAIPSNVAPIGFVYGDEKKAIEPPKEPPKAPAKDAYVAYELRVRAGGTELRLYTKATTASVPIERWQALLGQNEGAELEVSLRGLQASNKVSLGKPVRLRVLAATRDDAFAYWNDRLSAAVGTRIDGAAGDAAAAHPGVEPWLSRSADGTREASTHDGVLTVRERGAPLPSAWAESWHLDMPDWSPSGGALVFVGSSASSAPMMGMMGMPAAQQLTHQLLVSQLRDGSVAPPQVALIVSEADESIRSPVYSADGRFLALERVKARDKAGALWLISAEGGEPEALMRKMGWPGDGAFPTWLASRAADEHWLVFSRALGPAGGKLPEDALQLWAAALRIAPSGKPELLGEPFWWPAQDPTGRNRRLLKSE
jgi:hypothetical protein